MESVYPIHEPHTTRYRTALRPRVVHTTCEKSPRSVANIRFPSPAAVTCHAVALNTSIPDCQRLESTEPRAQLNDPPIKLNEAQNSLRPSPVLEVSSG